MSLTYILPQGFKKTSSPNKSFFQCYYRNTCFKFQRLYKYHAVTMPVLLPNKPKVKPYYLILLGQTAKRLEITQNFTFALEKYF